jgi:glycosyltransferase involved in cell wall biosynthesis
MILSIVVPAFNEERYLADTLAYLNRATEFLVRERGIQSEIIVVDNNSNDSTANIARASGTTVIKEELHNVAEVRNTGAKCCRGDVIVFVDADTLVSDKLLARIADAMSDETCLGGAVDTEYRPTKLTVKAYLQFWRIIGKLTGMAQGATQFYRKDIFFTLKGYDQTLFMGEDVDLYWRLKKFARRQNRQVVFIEDIRVVPSTRRFDQWKFWRTFIWTNPFFILMFRRNKKWWYGWYSGVPR